MYFMLMHAQHRIDLLESTLRWRHVLPTAPDTLASYPFYDTEPFIIAEAPHVYFAGNQPAFETRLVTGLCSNLC